MLASGAFIIALSLCESVSLASSLTSSPFRNTSQPGTSSTTIAIPSLDVGSSTCQRNCTTFKKLTWVDAVTNGLVETSVLHNTRRKFTHSGAWSSSFIKPSPMWVTSVNELIDRSVADTKAQKTAHTRQNSPYNQHGALTTQKPITTSSPLHTSSDVNLAATYTPKSQTTAPASPALPHHAKHTTKVRTTHVRTTAGTELHSHTREHQTSRTAKKKLTSTTKAGPIIVIGTHSITPNSKTEYIISDKTLELHSPVTIGSGAMATTVSLHIQGTKTYGVVNKHTSTLKAGSYASDTARLLIGSHTLQPGSPTVVSHETYSLARSGPTVYVNGVPQSIDLNEATTVITLSDGAAVSELRVSTTHPTPVHHSKPDMLTNHVEGYIIGTKTLFPGSIAVVSGKTYSLAPDGSIIYIDGHPEEVTLNTASPVLTLPSGVVMTQAEESVVLSEAAQHSADGTMSHEEATVTTEAYIIGGKTLLEGKLIVVSRHTFSLASGGSVIYNDGRPKVTLNQAKPVTTLSNGIVVSETEITKTISTSVSGTGGSNVSVAVAKGDADVARVTMKNVLVMMGIAVIYFAF